MSEAGYTEGRNVAIEYRGADHQLDRLLGLAADLTRRQVSLIAAGGSPASALAAKSVTATIPIVFANAADPVQIGLVASLNRPGGNVTGFTQLGADLGGKRMGLLRELVPSATSMAVLVNPTRPGVDAQSAQAQEAARALGLQLHVLIASRESDFDAIFLKLVQLQVGALVISADALFNDRRDKIIALAKHYTVPTIYEWREAVAAGGLISYGTRRSDSYRQIGILAGRILKGEKPADLPVLQPTKLHPGGHGPMWDIAEDKNSIKLIGRRCTHVSQDKEKNAPSNTIKTQRLLVSHLIANVWRLQARCARCANSSERWNANIRFRIFGNRLTWSSEHGTVDYMRCSG